MNIMNSNPDKLAFRVGDVLTDKSGTLMTVADISIGKNYDNSEWSVLLLLDVKYNNGTAGPTQVRMEEILQELERGRIWVA